MTDYRSLPKIDLHLHLDGSLRPSTVEDLARAAGRPDPSGDAARSRVSPDCRSLPEFLATFDTYLPLLGNAAALRRVARELIQDQHADGVVYVEARFAPTLWGDSFAPEAAIEAAAEGLAEGAAKTGVRWGLILCGIRSFPPATTTVTVRLAHRYLSEGVVGVDIAGDERAAAAPHREAFDLAGRLGVPITFHAGEAGPAANVREALEFGATRIGHGVRAVDDPAVLDFVRARGATFEMCLTSNLQTRSVPSLAQHPFPRLFRDGFNVTLNTDDPGVQGSTLSQDYALAERTFGMSRADLLNCLHASVRASFASDETRSAVWQRIEEGWQK